MDGSSSKEGSEISLILTEPEEQKFEYTLRLKFKASNNDVEYEALIQGLELSLKVKENNLLVYSDSQLVVEQVNSHYEAKEPNMIKYLSRVNQLINHFKSFEIKQVPKSQNVQADALSNLTSTRSS